MFGFIIFVIVLSFIGRLFSRPRYGYYYRPRMNPFGGLGWFGMGMGRNYGPMHHGPHHMHHHGPMGRGRRW